MNVLITQTQIRQARQTNLAQYLLSQNEPLQRDGSTRHKHKIHKSLVFWQNSYYWNSKNESGNSIDYLVRHMGMTFETAVTALIGFIPIKEKAGQEKKEFEKSSDIRRVYAYLHKTRKLDYRIIQNLIDANLLHQEVKTNNAVFAMHDEHDQEVGAELEGTLSEKRFKGVREGSKFGYGFNVHFSPVERRYEYALYFESAIDLLSFYELKTMLQGKSLFSCILISMAGLKANVIEHTQSVFGGRPILCVDNDKAGKELAQKTKIRLLSPDDGFKDWNEQLQFQKNIFQNP